jgi:TolB-like protein/Tfp pilus assembly protein PilF
VADFGISVESRDPGDGDVTSSANQLPMGTFNCMAPEQLEGKPATRRTDVYALGLIAYETLVGQLPYDSDHPLSAALKRVKGSPPAPGTIIADIPELWDVCITRCLTPDPKHRFQSPEAFIDALRKGQAKRRFPPTWLPTLRNKLLAACLLLALAVGVLFAVFATRGNVVPDTTGLRAIAVLPFRNASGDPNIEYLSDGIAEEIIHSLGYLRGVRVVARNSAFRYRRDDVDLASVARKLGVDLILVGSVQKIGGRIQIRATLSDATNKQLWTQVYDRELKEVFAVQDEIAAMLASTLRVKIATDRQAALERRTRDVEAYDLFLKARFQAARRDRSGLESAAELLQRATQRDPGYAVAHAELGNCYLLLSDYGFSSAGEILSPARAALMRSIQLDPGLSDGYAVLGQLYALFDWDWPNAEKAFQHAIDLNPNYASAHHWYSQLLLRLGRTNEALARAEESLRLDPVSVPAQTFLGWLYFYARQYRRALAAAEDALQLSPYFIHAHLLRSQAAAHLGDAALAESEVRQAAALANDEILSGRYSGTILAIVGKRAEALRHLAALQRAGGTRQSAFTAYLCAYLGLRAETFKWLERAYAERDPSLTLVKTHPAMDRFKRDPVYIAFLDRMKMPLD